jgi:Protein of unknown function (DUF3168)
MTAATDPQVAVQTAIYSALSGDTALTTLLGGANIFDQVPKGQAVPFVVVGVHVNWNHTHMGSGHINIAP